MTSLFPIVTAWVLVALAIFCAIYDLFALQYGGYEATITSRIIYLSGLYPIIPFALGVLIGHVLWPTFPPPVVVKS